MNNFSPLDFDLFSDIPLESISSSPVRSIPKIKNPLNSRPNLGDHKLEIEDPTPDIWEMFHDFDQRFFNGILISRGVEVDWSPKMTLCAGLCRYSPATFMCSIKLSKPLLQLRSRKDLVETLIHEMIHALLFVLRESDNRESHGPKFHENMYRINQAANLDISVYHTFHDEVNHYRTHIWKCNGVCRNRPPYFGTVKRSVNRKPGPYDTWFAKHQQTCGGVFEKVSEPEDQGSKKTKETVDIPKCKDIRTFFTPTKSTTNNSNKIVGFEDLIKKEEDSDDYAVSKSIIPFTGAGQVLGGSSNSESGKSILLTRFGKNSSKVTNAIKMTSATITSSTITSSTITSSVADNFISTTNSNKISSKSLTNKIVSSNDQLIVLDDSEEDNRNKSPVDHFDCSMDSKRKKTKFEETIILSDEEEDDKEYEWLKDLSNEELMKISEPVSIILDDD